MVAAVEIESRSAGCGALFEADEDNVAPMRVELDWAEIYALASKARHEAEGNPSWPSSIIQAISDSILAAAQDGF
jgi:hypothetical protein